jgi:hypothetical protein
MTNDVVWTVQASSAAGVVKRCPSVPARVWWYSVNPARVVPVPFRESELRALVGMLISVNVLASAGWQKGWDGEFEDGFFETSLAIGRRRTARVECGYEDRLRMLVFR